jgi:hypothetical protein
MPCIHFGTLRSILTLTILSSTLTVGARTAGAQSESTWSAGVTLGLTTPVGGWRGDLEAGTEYRVTVTRQRVRSRWAAEGELARHAFTFADAALAARQDGSERGVIRQTSLGIGLRYAVVERSELSTWVSGGVAVHSVRTSLWSESPISDPVLLRDEYVPGLSAGLGIALGPFRVQPVAEVRLRLVALRERPLVSVPIAVGLRF